MMGHLWGPIFAFEMHANFAHSPLALLPPGFYASEMSTRDREVLNWGTLNAAGGASARPGAGFHVV
jgi:hypothetical protein